ncbi:hypothetical protein B0H16DRAFT_1463461 [Mycena metata]|uniref:Uncharacterized protein n=1 Tax=Mycena metata TaxID=1033252 RepID=A0AAD7IIA7_9AGAR|nr:hypothetical protein B0H16DRAFT_1463461 [Mycena metata]
MPSVNDSEEDEWTTVPIRRRAKDRDTWSPPRPHTEWPTRPPGCDITPYTWIPGTWYTDSTLRWPWSTDWENWEGLAYYMLFDGKPMVERMFNETFDVGTIEPLAYVGSKRRGLSLQRQRTILPLARLRSHRPSVGFHFAKRVSGACVDERAAPNAGCGRTTAPSRNMRAMVLEIKSCRVPALTN